MQAVMTLLLLLVVCTPAVAAREPPLLPASIRIDDLTVAASTVREFDVELPRTEKWLAWEIARAGSSGVLSGTLLLSMADGQLLREVRLDGLEQSGGLVVLPASAGGRRVRVSFRGGAQQMRADLSLLPSRPQLKSGQPVPVFARRRGSDAFAEALELRLAKASDVDLRTWGGDASVSLEVRGPLEGAGIPAVVCEDGGDAWRRCLLPALKAGTYHVSVQGSGGAVHLLATSTAIDMP